MVWAKSMLAGGLVLLAVAFGVGTEQHHSAASHGQTYECGAAIPSSWLVSGAPGGPGPSATPEDRRAATACRPVIGDARLVVLPTMGVAALVALFGWAGVREPRPASSTRLAGAG